MSARHDAPRGRVLVVLHQEHSCPARIGRLLHTMGYELDMRRPRYGEALPKTLAAHAGAIILGGPMSVNDPDEWVRREIDFVGVALKENAPLLGVCLGGQMIARHLGERVAPHPHGLAEIGYYPVEPTEAGHGSAPRRSRSTSINGTSKVSTCRAARNCSRAARRSRTRRSAMAARSGCSSTPK